MTVGEWARVGRHYWALLLCFTLVGAIAGVGYATFRPSDYSARASVVISGRADIDGRNAGQLTTYIQGMMQTYSDVATEQIVLDGVAEQLGDGTSWGQLRDKVDAEAPMGSTLINLTVTDPDRERAAQIANLIPGQLQRVIPELSSGSSQGPITVTQTSQAVVPPPHGWNAVLPAALVGAAAGLVLGLILAYLRESSSTAGKQTARRADQPIEPQLPPVD